MQDILLWAYPEPPHAGQLHTSPPPRPSSGIGRSDTSPCKMSPTASSEHTQRIPAGSSPPTQPCCHRCSQKGVAGRRCHRRDTPKMSPHPHPPGWRQLLSQQPPGSSGWRGEEQLQVLIIDFPTTCPDDRLLLLSTSPAPLNPFSAPQGGFLSSSPQ